jgi:hypothetical protein
MHLANFTALRALGAVLLAPLALGAGALEPQALIKAAMATRARAAGGRRHLFMCSPVGSECV